VTATTALDSTGPSRREARRPIEIPSESLERASSRPWVFGCLQDYC
jgi:hypothetical protein